MPDYRVYETKKIACTAIRNLIKSQKNIKGSQLRLMVMENYGLAGSFVDDYLKELHEEGIVKVTFIAGKADTVQAHE